MARTRKNNLDGIASPLRSLPTDSRPRKNRVNATAKSPAKAQENIAQESDNTSPSQSPPPNESRSQSPQVAESRSTSPPTQRYNTRRAASRSVSPNHLTTQINKSKARVTKTATGAVTVPAKRKATASKKGGAGSSNTTGASKAGTKRARVLAVSTLDAIKEVPGEESSAKRLPKDTSTPSRTFAAHELMFANESPRAQLNPSKKRSRPETSTHQSAGSPDDEAFDGRPAKRARTDNGGAFNEQYTPRPNPNALTPKSSLKITARSQRETLSLAQSSHEDESISDADIVGDLRPTQYKESASQEPVLVEEEPSSREYNPEGHRRPSQAETTPINRSFQRQPITCPPIGQTSVAEDFGFDKKPLSKDPREREREIQDRFPGARKVNPVYNSTLRRESFPMDGYESEHEEEQPPFAPGEFKRLGATLRTAKYNYFKTVAPLANIPLSDVPRHSVPKSLDNRKSSRKQLAITSGPEPSRTVPDFALVIPASLSGDEMILTDNELIEATRALAMFKQSNPNHILPNPEQLTAFLESHNSQRSAFAATLLAEPHQDLIGPPTAENVSSDNETQHEAEGSTSDLSDLSDPPISDGDDTEPEAQSERGSEVQEIQQPRTPIQEPTTTLVAPESRGWTSAITNMLTTPFKFFGRNQQAAEAANANASTETEFTYAHLTSISQPPSTPTPYNSLFRGKAQSEKRKRVQFSRNDRSQIDRLYPQTDRHPRAKKMAKNIPFYERGTITPSRKKEIQRERDLLSEGDRRARDNMIFGKKRLRNDTAYETDSQQGEYESTFKTGSKRKHVELSIEIDNLSGTFRVPDDSDSEEEVTGGEEVRDEPVTSGAEVRDEPVLPSNYISLSPDIPLSPSKVPLSERTLIEEGRLLSLDEIDQYDEEFELYMKQPWRQFSNHTFGMPSLKSCGYGKRENQRSWFEMIACHRRGLAERELAFARRAENERAEKERASTEHPNLESFAVPGEGSRAKEALIPHLVTPREKSGREDRAYLDKIFGHEPGYHETGANKSPFVERSESSKSSDGLETDASDMHHARPYTGNHFQQPKTVQANINEGLPPLARRSSSVSQILGENVFATQQKMQNAQAIPQTPNPMPTNSFSVPDGASDDDDEGEEAREDRSSAAEGASRPEENKSVKGDAPETSTAQTVLQEKQWQQTPPPKPRPSNAQLPNQVPSAADIAKANATRYQPKNPSRLRNVTQMSPLQQLEEDRRLYGGYEEMNSMMEIDDETLELADSARKPPVISQDLPKETVDEAWGDLGADFEEVEKLVMAIPAFGPIDPILLAMSN